MTTPGNQSADYRQRLIETLDSEWVDYFNEVEPYIFGDKKDEEIRSDFFTAIHCARQGRKGDAEYWKYWINRKLNNDQNS